MRRLIGILICFLFSHAVFSQTVLLQKMMTKQEGNTLHVRLLLSADARYRSFTLQNPDRFVLDCRDTSTANQLTHLPPSSSMFITTFRYSERSQGGILRLVFQLPKGVIARVVKQNRSRELQIDFRNVSNPSLPLPIQTIAESPKFARTKTPRPVAVDTSMSRRHDIMIVIDPGHGGKDSGAIGVGGTAEKRVVLEISRALQKEINAQPRFHAVLTRNSDYFLTLRERLQIAREHHADMFVAIHADKFRNNDARGVSIFALSQRGATSEAARWLANRENASELVGGVKLDDQSHLLKSVLIDLSQSATIRASIEIGYNVMQAVATIARLHYRHVEQAAFVVLKSPDIPSLLIETGFLSNSSEEQRLRTDAYQRELAHAMTKGICGYFKKSSLRG